MKKTILLILILPMLASAQYFEVFDIDTTDYPIMKAKFYSIDANGKQILNHTPADFEITENGEPRDVISVSCPEPLDIPISVGIMVDTYKYINLARHGSERLVNILNMPQNEVAITYMNQRPLLFQDFTKLKAKAIESSKTIPEAPGGTKVSEMFYDDIAGGISIIKKQKAQNRVLIFISDLHCPNLDIDEQKLFQEAKDNNIRIYTVLINTGDYTGLFKRIAAETNGVLFESVKDSIEIEDVFASIAFREQNDPCEIVWNGKRTCEKSINLEVKNKLSLLSKIFKRQISDSQRVGIKSNPYFINFGNLKGGVIKDTVSKIVAINSEVSINNIRFEPDNGYYKVLNPLPINIPKNDSVELSISYIAADTSRQYSVLTLITDYCNISLGLLAGSKSGQFLQKTLELTQPNGGEVYIAGSDTIITWRGISENEVININFSSNNGKNWSLVSDSAIGLSQIWQIPNIKSKNCLISINQYTDINRTKIQERGLEWEKSFGGSDFDVANSITQTFDRGYIIAGYSDSHDGDITDFKKYSDYWILKLKADGDLDWQKSYGGSDKDVANSIVQTLDGGYIVAGYSDSHDGDMTNYKGASDYWILKLKANGELDWQKSYGGRKEDVANSIIQTLDGGYIIAGYSKSDEGDITNSIDGSDYWILKLKADGEIDWEKSYGGKNEDVANSIVQTFDGGYVVAGYSESVDGDVTNPRGGSDYWILKLKADGEIDWQRSYGGSDKDVAKSIVQTFDGGYVIAGFSESADGYIRNPKGDNDYWIIKLKEDGALDWEKSYGGSSHDFAHSITKTIEGGYIVAGLSSSIDGDISSPIKTFDYWIVKLREDGALDWEKSYGGSMVDHANSIIQTYDGNYIVAGYSQSTDGDISNLRVGFDFWILKFGAPPPPLQSDTSDAVFSIIMPEPVIQNNNIDMGQMIVGSTKDTIVSSVICNVGDAPLHVLGVDITGGNASEFLIPRGAGDFYLEKDSCQDMMFEFTPSALGNRTAVATIRTTIGDFQDTIHIRGVGIAPVIEVTSEVVDFGVFELGQGKDTTLFLVKNVGSTDITITDTQISGPDMEQFTLSTSPVNYTIAAGQEKEFKLNYTAKLGGKSNSYLDFHHQGIGSPLRSLLFAEGIGGEVYPVVADAYVGETVNLNLFLGKIKPEGLREIATKFSAIVSYNSTILAPIDKSMSVNTILDKSFISIAGKLSGVPQIATIPMKVGLGTDDRSGLVITEFQLYNANGDSVDYDIEPGVGEFKVLGICEEGGKRLINPNGDAVEMQVVAVSNSGNAHIYLTLIETGQTELEIYDQIGNKIETVYSGTPSAGSQEINLDLSKYANGRYYIKLTTPTITKTEIIEVVR